MGCFQSSEAGLHDQSKMARGGLGLRAGSEGAGGDAAAAMLGNNALSSRVELFVSCAGLRNLDSGSKSDPFCVLEEWRENGVIKIWNEEAQLIEQSHYMKGLKNGLSTKWHNNGQILELCN